MEALFAMAAFAGVIALIGVASKGPILPGGVRLSNKQWRLLSTEYQRLELQYNLAAQAAGNPPYWIAPAYKYGTDDPMAQLAALNVDENDKARRAVAAGRGDFGVGFFSGYTTGRM